MRFALHFTKSIALLAILFVASPASTMAKPYWFETYQRAVELIDKGQAEEATSLLERVLEERPTPVSGLKIPGSQFIDYLPHFQRARAYVQLGKLESAAKSLNRSESYGALTESMRYLKQYAELRKSIGTPLTVKASVP